VGFPFGFGDPDGSPGGMLELISIVEVLEIEKRSKEHGPKKEKKS
jgi:hypothetical protein